MSAMLDKQIVLELNKHWQRTKWRTVRDAIKTLCPEERENANALAIPIGPNGIEGHPIPWDEWVKLPVRDCDLAISTGRGAIRVPLAIIASNYGDMPTRAPVLSKDGIFERDGHTDQYSGEKLTKAELSVDHVIPKDVWRRRGLKGSPDRWDNLVTCKKRRNFDKGNKTNREAGLKLIRKPKAPKEVPICFLISEARHPYQKPLFE